MFDKFYQNLSFSLVKIFINCVGQWSAWLFENKFFKMHP